MRTANATSTFTTFTQPLPNENLSKTHLVTIAADTANSNTNVARNVYTGDGRHSRDVVPAGSGA